MRLECTGASNLVNKSLYAETLLVNPDGSLPVGKWLEIQTRDGQPISNIYGAGDCVQTLRNSTKLGYIAMLQASYLCKHLTALATAKQGAQKQLSLEQHKLEEYSKTKEPEVLLIQLGSGRVMLVKKNGISTCFIYSSLKKYVEWVSLGDIKGTFFGKTLSSINAFVNRVMYT